MQNQIIVQSLLKAFILGVCFLTVNTHSAMAQNAVSEEQKIISLSKDKWQWMADKNVDKLATLFDDKSKFVHMSGTWKKEEELEIIKSGSIWYKKADVHDVAVEMVGNTAIVWSRITLSAMVRGNEANTEFTVTEVYTKQDKDWKMLALTFSSVRDTHVISIEKNDTFMTNLLLAFLCLISACSPSQTDRFDAPAKPEMDSAKILIVYLSRTNNTKAVAKIIHKQVGGKLVAIELENPYPQHHQTTVAQVAMENETGFLPSLKTKIDSIQNYDIVFIGFPTRGMQLPPPLKSFLKQYDMGGKTVIPFNTNGGYDIGSAFETVRELCPDSKKLEGYSTRGGLERDGQLLMIRDEQAQRTEEDVKKWLQKLKMI